MAPIARTISNGPTQDNTAIGVKVEPTASGDIQYYYQDILPATTVTESTATSTTSNTIALAANANRKGGYLVNDSDTDIHVSWGGTPAATTQKVRANGGVLPFMISGQVYLGLIRTIHFGSGSKTLFIVELT